MDYLTYNQFIYNWSNSSVLFITRLSCVHPTKRAKQRKLALGKSRVQNISVPKPTLQKLFHWHILHRPRNTIGNLMVAKNIVSQSRKVRINLINVQDEENVLALWDVQELLLLVHLANLVQDLDVIKNTIGLLNKLTVNPKADRQVLPLDLPSKIGHIVLHCSLTMLAPLILLLLLLLLLLCIECSSNSLVGIHDQNTTSRHFNRGVAIWHHSNSLITGIGCHLEIDGTYLIPFIKNNTSSSKFNFSAYFVILNKQKSSS